MPGLIVRFNNHEILVKRAVYVAVGIFLGFAFAWLIKPEKAAGTVTIESQRTRAKYPIRSTDKARAFTDQEADEFFKHMRQAGTDQEQRDALFGQISDGEVRALLEELRVRAGYDGLDDADEMAIRGLLTTWYLRSPAAALAWLQYVDNDAERNKLVGGIVENLASRDLDAAMDLLRKQGPDRLGIQAFSSGLFEAALGRGVGGLLEVCGIGIYRGPSRGISSQRVTYPDGFDFRRALDGLAEIKAAIGGDAKFMALPSDLVGEWTKRDPQAAWAWLQQDKVIDGSGKFEFFSSYAAKAEPTDVASLLAADFKPEATAEARYQNILWVLDEHPSSEMFNAILDVIPGDRAANLRGLLDERAGFVFDTEDMDPVSKLILERMEPGERLTGLRGMFRDIDSDPFDLKDAARKGITPLLLRMGHSQEEIASLFPPDKEE